MILRTAPLKPAVEAGGKAAHEIHVPCRIWPPKPSDHVPMTQILDLNA